MGSALFPELHVREIPFFFKVREFLPSELFVLQALCPLNNWTPPNPPPPPKKKPKETTTTTNQTKQQQQNGEKEKKKK